MTTPVVDGFFQVGRTSDSFPARVFGYIDAAGDCWEWTETVDADGYGLLGRGVRGSGNIPAHRAVWELLYGPIPNGMVYDHRCRNPTCVSPEHGEIVTDAENKRRGYSPAAQHARRGTCSKGHQKDGWTTRRTGKNAGQTHRYCKTCARAKTNTRYHRKKAATTP